MSRATGSTSDGTATMVVDREEVEMKRFQIRDDDFGLALVDAETAREALLEFVAGKAQADARMTVEEQDDGAATVVYDGVRYRAIPAGGAS